MRTGIWVNFPWENEIGIGNHKQNTIELVLGFGEIWVNNRLGNGIYNPLLSFLGPSSPSVKKSTCETLSPVPELSLPRALYRVRD